MLSGGGAQGAFQFGALLYIEQVIKPRIPGFGFDLISGVSVGAVNGAMYALNKMDALEKVWRSPNLSRLIFNGKLEWMTVVRRVLANEKSLLDNEPFFHLIQRYIHRDEFPANGPRLHIGAVSLRDGNLYTLSPDDFPTNYEFQLYLLASTAIPILWPPVPEVITRDRILYDLVDGSLRDTSPLGDVVQENPDEVVIINCASRSLPMPEDPHAGKNIFSIAKRALIDIAVNEIFENDLREYLKINDFVRQVNSPESHGRLTHRRDSGEEVELKDFRTILIEPLEDIGSLLDFEEATIESRIAHGFKAAAHAYYGYFGSGRISSDI